MEWYGCGMVWCSVVWCRLRWCEIVVISGSDTSVAGIRRSDGRISKQKRYGMV